MCATSVIDNVFAMYWQNHNISFVFVIRIGCRIISIEFLIRENYRYDWRKNITPRGYLSPYGGGVLPWIWCHYSNEQCMCDDRTSILVNCTRALSLFYWPASTYWPTTESVMFIKLSCVYLVANWNNYENHAWTCVRM